jgi:hypothetical protein
MGSYRLSVGYARGVNVCQMRILGEGGGQEALGLVWGLVLLILVTGIWACLWVPPLGR